MGKRERIFLASRRLSVLAADMKHQSIEAALEHASIVNAVDQLQRRRQDVLQEASNKENSAKVDRAYAAKLKRDIACIEAPLQKVELYVEAKLVKTFLGGDLDDAIIYAAARPAFTFFIEQWGPGDAAGGNRELLHSEFYSASVRNNA
jgi:hypothetical protein